LSPALLLLNHFDLGCTGSPTLAGFVAVDSAARLVGDGGGGRVAGSFVDVLNQKNWACCEIVGEGRGPLGCCRCDVEAAKSKVIDEALRLEAWDDELASEFWKAEVVGDEADGSDGYGGRRDAPAWFMVNVNRFLEGAKPRNRKPGL